MQSRRTGGQGRSVGQPSTSGQTANTAWHQPHSTPIHGHRNSRRRAMSAGCTQWMRMVKREPRPSEPDGSACGLPADRASGARCRSSPPRGRRHRSGNRRSADRWGFLSRSPSPLGGYIGFSLWWLGRVLRSSGPPDPPSLSVTHYSEPCQALPTLIPANGLQPPDQGSCSRREQHSHPPTHGRQTGEGPACHPTDHTPPGAGYLARHGPTHLHLPAERPACRHTHLSTGPATCPRTLPAPQP